MSNIAPIASATAVQSSTNTSQSSSSSKNSNDQDFAALLAQLLEGGKKHHHLPLALGNNQATNTNTGAPSGSAAASGVSGISLKA